MLITLLHEFLHDRQAAAATAAALGQNWSCPSCGILNIDSFRNCCPECKYDRMNPKSGPDGLPPVACPVVVDPKANWACPRCGGANIAAFRNICPYCNFDKINDSGAATASMAACAPPAAPVDQGMRLQAEAVAAGDAAPTVSAEKGREQLGLQYRKMQPKGWPTRWDARRRTWVSIEKPLTRSEKEQRRRLQAEAAAAGAAPQGCCAVM